MLLTNNSCTKQILKYCDNNIYRLISYHNCNTCFDVVSFEYFWQTLNVFKGIEMMNTMMKTIHSILMTW